MRSISIRFRAHWLGLGVFLALIPALLVQIQRGQAALSSPLPSQTTGCEEESFYALWRANHGQKVYADSSLQPYSSAYFNWLFYRAYGAVAAGHPDEEIPYWGRICTLVGAIMALLFCGWTLALAPNRLVCGALAGLAFLSSGLFGWWLFTVRPDTWAMTLEIASATWFLTFYPRRRWLAIIGGVVLAYLAWSLKQANLSVIGTLVLFLVCQRQKYVAFAAAGLFAFMTTATLLIGGIWYRSSLASAASGFDGWLGWANLLSATVHALPVIVLPVYALALWFGDDCKPWTSSVPIGVQFGAAGLLVSGTLAFGAGFKSGASYNYYFTAVFFATLLGMHSRFALQNLFALRIGDAVVMLALGTGGILACLQLSGRLGTHSLAAANAVLNQRLKVWSTLPTPRFSSDRRLALPWLNPGEPVFFPAYNYPADRSRLRSFQGDGLGGLIREGYFSSLLLPEDTQDKYDGNRLSDHYVRASSVAGLAVYLRIPVPPSPASP